MQKRKIKGLDQRATAGQEKESTGAKAGRKDYTRKSGKGSSLSRKKGGKAGGGRKRQSDKRGTAYKIADLLPKETIKKLKELKR